MTFNDFKQSDLAEATLRVIHRVMEAAEPFHPNEPWRNMPAEHHIHRAFMHSMRAYSTPNSKEDGQGANTGLLDWHHALTRLAMVACLSEPKIEPSAPVVEITIEE